MSKSHNIAPYVNISDIMIRSVIQKATLQNPPEEVVRLLKAEKEEHNETVLVEEINDVIVNVNDETQEDENAIVVSDVNVEVKNVGQQELVVKNTTMCVGTYFVRNAFERWEKRPKRIKLKEAVQLFKNLKHLGRVCPGARYCKNTFEKGSRFVEAIAKEWWVFWADGGLFWLGWGACSYWAGRLGWMGGEWAGALAEWAGARAVWAGRMGCRRIGVGPVLGCGWHDAGLGCCELKWVRSCCGLVDWTATSWAGFWIWAEMGLSPKDTCMLG
ncbi:UNVERIFIED_CONTAM: hypothetical protein Sradi_3467700 [Sesamum radiatum]|uniref:Uncharacterized protein n=1 Tax=Sesamum radiatum TaxID=300843 RepID=A0AAW2QDX8_SESRA